MSRAEIQEPAEFAVSSVARALRDIIDRRASEFDASEAAATDDVDPEWLIIFLDLVDKARAASPDPRLLAVINAALASAPAEDRGAAQEALRAYERELRGELRGGTRLQPEARTGPEVLIVVPKPLEQRACLTIFDAGDVSPKRFDTSVRYRRFPLSERNSTTTVTLVCMQDAGNILAANLVRDYVAAFGRPDLAVLCGMAMGVTDKIKEGDVVVAKQLIDYGPRRVTVDGDRTRFEAFRPPQRVLGDLQEHVDAGRDAVTAAARAALPVLRERGLEVPQAAEKEGWRPKVHPGVILAADQLVEDLGAGQTSLHDRVYAVEMEGAGFAATCHHLGCDWAVVRGVADHGEADRSKAWQPVATAAAAGFVASFLTDSRSGRTGGR